MEGLPAAAVTIGAHLNRIITHRQIEEGEATVGIIDRLQQRITESVKQPHAHISHGGVARAVAEVVVDGHIHRTSGGGGGAEAEGHHQAVGRVAFIEEADLHLVVGQAQSWAWIKRQQDVGGGAGLKRRQGGGAIERQPRRTGGQHHVESAGGDVARVGDGDLMEGALAEQHGGGALGSGDAKHRPVGQDREREGLTGGEGRLAAGGGGSHHIEGVEENGRIRRLQAVSHAGGGTGGEGGRQAAEVDAPAGGGAADAEAAGCEGIGACVAEGDVAREGGGFRHRGVDRRTGYHGQTLHAEAVFRHEGAVREGVFRGVLAVAGGHAVGAGLLHGGSEGEAEATGRAGGELALKLLAGGLVDKHNGDGLSGHARAAGT